MNNNKLIIIVPCYNEQEVIVNTIRTLTNLLTNMHVAHLISDDSKILLVDDGSNDNTWKIINEESCNNPKISGIRLTRNSGQQIALMAGCAQINGLCDMAVTIDADLQDDETKIIEMVERYKEGYDIVYGVRESRKVDSLFKRTSAQTFYRFMQAMGVKTVYNHADYRLLSARAINQLLKYRETNMYLRGIVSTLGYKTACVYYDRKRRDAGVSKYPISRLLSLAFNGITSFSIRPMHMIMYLGIIFIFVAVCIVIWVLWCKLRGQAIVGWSSLIISIWFCSGCVLTSLGLIGEYVGRTYMEVKQRPRYAIMDEINC